MELIRDPRILLGMILMPVLILPLMGFAITISQESVERSVQEATLGVVDLDDSQLFAAMTSYLGEQPGTNLVEFHVASAEEALDELPESETKLLILIPDCFADQLAQGERAPVRIYTELETLSMTETIVADVASDLVDGFSRMLSLETIGGAFPEVDPRVITDPIELLHTSVFRERSLEVSPATLSGVLLLQSITLPLVIMLVLIFAMQMAATSIAMEKEEKTLETLLTLPVHRMTILTGKLGGSVVLAAAGSIAYMVGFGYYMGSVTSLGGGDNGAVDLGALGLSPTIESYVLLGLTIFVTLISALALALTLAVFSEDVRSAQALMGVLYIPIFLPAIILMFTDISALPPAMQAVLLAIPYTHSMLATKMTLVKDYVGFAGSIVYIGIFTVAVLYLTARVFSSERIVTAKLSFERLGIKSLLRREQRNAN